MKKLIIGNYFFKNANLNSCKYMYNVIYSILVTYHNIIKSFNLSKLNSTKIKSNWKFNFIFKIKDNSYIYFFVYRQFSLNLYYRIELKIKIVIKTKIFEQIMISCFDRSNWNGNSKTMFKNNISFLEFKFSWVIIFCYFY